MFANFGFTDSYVRIRVEELLREAENDRLADRAAGPARPWRTRVAGWLKATAQWVEGQPQASVARAEA
jgi:hypothetical protein